MTEIVEVSLAVNVMAFCSKLTRSKAFIAIVSVLWVLLVGIADYATGIEINLAIFYLVAVAFVTWLGSRNGGILISVLATTTSFVSDIGFDYSYWAIPYWNAVMRGGVFLIVVFLLSRLKIALLREQETSKIKSDMLSLVGHLNLAMTSVLDLSSVGKNLLETIEVFFPNCATTIRLLNQETGEFELLASANLDEPKGFVEPADWLASRKIPEMSIEHRARQSLGLARMV